MGILGDALRAYINEKVDDKATDIEDKADALVTKIRLGGEDVGAEELEKAEKMVEDIEKAEEDVEEMEKKKEDFDMSVERAEKARQAQQASEDASEVGAALNPAAAAIKQVAKKIREKFEEK